MKYFIFAALMLVIAQGKPVFAQHEGHQMPQPKPAASPSEPKPTAAPSPQAPAAQPEMDMSGHMDHGVFVVHDDEMFIRLGQSESNLVPMGRMGSGTSWQPDSSPMPMLHKQSGEWLLMFHYNFTVGVNRQGGPRGVTKFESANWFMPSAIRRAGPGTLELRAMLSAEPFTFPPGGSPLLFQTGETYKGEPLIDRQHPHDLFMELSATYTVPLVNARAGLSMADTQASPRLVQMRSCIVRQRPRTRPRRFRITCRIRHTSALESSRPASRIAGSSSKALFLTDANQERIVTTSKRIRGIHAPSIVVCAKQ